jgi:hypothetical protein
MPLHARLGRAVGQVKYSPPHDLSLLTCHGLACPWVVIVKPARRCVCCHSVGVHCAARHHSLPGVSCTQPGGRFPDTGSAACIVCRSCSCGSCCTAAGPLNHKCRILECCFSVLCWQRHHTWAHMGAVSWKWQAPAQQSHPQHYAWALLTHVGRDGGMQASS